MKASTNLDELAGARGQPPRTSRQLALSKFAAAYANDLEETLTLRERHAARRFREVLQQIGRLQPFWDNPLIAHRYCAAHDYDVDKAVDMFLRHLAWRREVGLDDGDVATSSGHHHRLDEGHVPQHDEGHVPQLLLDFKLPELRELMRHRPFGFHKCDKSGRPVAYDRAGGLSARRLKETLYPREGDRWMETYLRYFIWFQEATLQYRLPACSLAAGRLVHSSVYVVDMAGFSYASFTPDFRAALRAAAFIAAEQYPGTMERIFVLNAPRSFRIVWTFLRALIPRQTAAMISILGGPQDYLPQLDAYIDRANLPDWLGGDDSTCDFQRCGAEHGPWAAELPSLLPDEGRALAKGEGARPYATAGGDAAPSSTDEDDEGEEDADETHDDEDDEEDDEEMEEMEASEDSETGELSVEVYVDSHMEEWRCVHFDLAGGATTAT